MKRGRRKITADLIGVLLAVVAWPLLMGMACGARVNSVTSSPELQLRSFKTVYVTLLSSGGLSINTTTLGDIETTTLMDAEAAAGQALSNFQFRLLGMGFDVVDSPTSADAVLELSLGAIRYDPIGGWITDKATLSIKERETKRAWLACTRQKDGSSRPVLTS